jgi:flagellar biosynthesis/type III secretory pathway protein FliH
MILFDDSHMMSPETWSPKWQAEQLGFAPRWHTNEGAEVETSKADHVADSEREQALTAAYADGYAAAERDSQVQNILAVAMTKLAVLPRPEVEAQLSQIIIDVMRQFFAAHSPTAAEIQNYVADALNALGDGAGQATILLHPDDAAFLDNNNLPDTIKIKTDESLTRGIVRLDHSAGRILQGRSIAMDSIADILGASC